MKPSIFNSINDNEPMSPDSINGLIEYYTDKIHAMYVNLLKELGVEHLDEKITVVTTLSDNDKVTNTFKAGHHVIEMLFQSGETRRDIEKLDKKFLTLCPCNHKTSILNQIKYLLMEVGSETIDKQEWADAISGLNTCEDLNNIDDF